MNLGIYFLAVFIFLNPKTATSSKIPTEFTQISSLLQSRIKRDDDYNVKCHQSGTGTYFIQATYIWHLYNKVARGKSLLELWVTPFLPD